jgi:cupin fold WbuC family metalloprotein
MTKKPDSKGFTALPPPPAGTTLISTELIDQVVSGSRRSPRKRMILPLHKSHEASLHRMLNGIQPGSYIRPHRHLDPPKAESVIILQGAIKCLIFSHTGEVEAVHLLRAGSSVFGIDSDAGVYHTFLALEKDTVMYEAKPGPYTQATDKDFASWAPPEGSPAVAQYLQFLYDLGNPSTIRIS